METDIRLLTQNDYNIWDRFYEISPQRNPFQSVKYHKALQNKDNVSAVAIGLFKEGKLVGLTVITLWKGKGLSGFFSRRGIIFGGPLLNNISDDDCTFFFSKGA